MTTVPAHFACTNPSVDQEPMTASLCHCNVGETVAAHRLSLLSARVLTIVEERCTLVVYSGQSFVRKRPMAARPRRAINRPACI